MPGPGTFFGIEIARRGIFSHQKSLEVTGHNIANANNPEYSRQEAIHTASSPWPYPSASSGVTPGQLGTGVGIEQIRRIRNHYLDAQFRNTSAGQSYWESRMEILEQVESIFPEPDGRGIQEVLVTFFSDWHALNNAPQDDGIKSAVVESGKELARLFRDTYASLEDVNTSIVENNTTGKIPDQVDRINELADRIAELTRNIIRVRREGREPNDLLDKRDALLDELSQYAPVQVESVLDSGKDLGGITVTIFPSSNSEPLIKTDPTTMNVTTQDVGVSYDDTSKKIELSIDTSVINLTNIAQDSTNSEFEDGSLLGLVSAWQENISFMNNLNTLARELGEQVNSAYAPDSTLGLPANFFVDENGNPFDNTTGKASNIYIHQGIKNEPAKVDGEQALAVARLRNETFTDLGDNTLEGYYRGLVAEIGSKTESSRNMNSTQQAVLNQVTGLRQSTSGVSIDEELSNMIQFQYGYQASARMLTTLDSILDTLINRMAV